MVSLRRSACALVTCGAVGVGGCRASDLLTVSPPAGVTSAGANGGAPGALAQAIGAVGAFNTVYGSTIPCCAARSLGQLDLSSLLTDEMNYEYTDPLFVPVDARDASVGVGIGAGAYTSDNLYSQLQKARLNALFAARAVQGTMPTTGKPQIALMFTLAGYAELFLAEDFCSGVPLSALLPGTAVSYGDQLTTDSLLGHAAAEFDSAVAYAGGDSVSILAQLGLARAVLDRGRYIDARTAVSGIPTAFSYAAALSANVAAANASYYVLLASNPFRSTADRKGGNGLPYVSAHDPRMPIDSSLGANAIGGTFYYPAKFPQTSGNIPLAQGIEARLIEAEAQLVAGDTAGWAGTLNALRADSADTHVGGLQPLTVDSTSGATPAARVDVMFRERAFWLYGTGRRLGDMRRLVRQYGRDQATVFPVGPYPLHGKATGAVAQYGADVNFPIAAVERQNPNFHGCIDRKA